MSHRFRDRARQSRRDRVAAIEAMLFSRLDDHGWKRVLDGSVNDWRDRSYWIIESTWTPAGRLIRLVFEAPPDEMFGKDVDRIVAIPEPPADEHLEPPTLWLYHIVPAEVDEFFDALSRMRLRG